MSSRQSRHDTISRTGRWVRYPAAPGRQRGQTSVGYVVIGLFSVIILLAVPVPGLEAGGHNMSVIGWMVHVLHQWWANYSYMISFA